MAKLIYSSFRWLLFIACCFQMTGVVAQKVKPPAPYGALPSQSQVEWQKMEYYMFIHFGPNTFTDKEWGQGNEDPKIFNPTNLDANQWARTAKAAGMKGIIITAKHHDGFCLWPSKYSTHTVRESAWKDGKGDVLRELSDACKKYGLKFGVYLSPWDRNHPDYGTPEYNQIFANTLDEVLTNYGDVFEQWFDGANGEGPNGKKQVYDWPLFYKTVYKNQPKAIIFSDIGPGCRWVGNENGMASETNWSTLNIKGYGLGTEAPPTSILQTGVEDGEKWIPAECDVSIRPGWFYSPSTNDKVKSVNQLLKIYNASVGRNGNFLLNVPVDRRGLIHANDSIRLMELKKVLDATFAHNLAKAKTATASNTRGKAKEFAAANLLDGNYDSYWTTDDHITQASLTIDLGKQVELNRVVLQEYIPLGQRVKAFSVEYWEGNTFKQLDQQTTIGYKRILAFATIKTSKLRINILDAKASPVLSEIQVYNAPEQLAVPQISRNKNGAVAISSESDDAVIRYTTDGTEPTLLSPVFSNEIDFAKGGIIKAKAFINNGKTFSETVSVDYDLAPVKWKVIGSDRDKRMENMVDGNPVSFWMAPENNPSSEVVIDMGEQVNLKGFTYTPRNNPEAMGTIYQYNFYVSEDGNNWIKVMNNAAFDNIKNNPVKQLVKFDRSYKVRFIKLESISTTDGNNKRISVAEIGALTR